MKLKNIVSIVVALIIIAAAVFIGIRPYSDSDVIEEPIPGNGDTPPPVGNLLFKDAVNAFAFDFFRELNSDDDSNSFISPYSIFAALAMTYEGAKDQTADEMADVLNVEQDNASFHSYMKDLYELLNRKNEEYSISTANALWVKQELQLLEEYLNVIREFYGGDATEVDFFDAVEAAGIINQWVEDNTNGLIKDLIQPAYITPLTALILTNAIYFKGIWKVQFDQINTSDRDFEISPGNTISVSTMKLVDTEDVFNYTETDDLQILELPYTGDDISMIILLPKDNDLSGIIESIDDDSLTEWKESMVEKNVNIYLPRFTVETSYLLKDYLMQLGMTTPFSSSADFSGITGYKDLFISEVVHKAYIDVNEEGTEAAAATAVIMELTSSNPSSSSRVVFDCDHPFMYLIQHKETGTILFMGNILDPST